MEETVAALQSKVEGLEEPTEENGLKTTTGDIRNYILDKIAMAASSGEDSVTFKASDIHREMKLKNRFPMVCNAMRQCMKENDEVVYETASGYSSSLEIKYYCG